MRDFLDSILEFIGCESLTDEEFQTISLTEPPAYTSEAYDALKTVLQARENVSDQVKRLKFYFIAKGVDLSGTSPVKKPVSHIFIGSEL